MGFKSQQKPSSTQAVAANNGKSHSAPTATKANPLWRNLALNVDRTLPEGVQRKKITVGAANDIYEQQADAVANAVTRGQNSPNPTIPDASGQPNASAHSLQKKPNSDDEESLQRKCEGCESEEANLQRKANKPGNAGPSANNVQSAVSSPGAGSPLPWEVRSKVEPVLGADLSNVRVHNNSQSQRAAKDIHAQAFTHRNQVHLGEGQSASNLNLMAHELTHVVQQGAASSTPDIQRRIVMRTITPNMINLGIFGEWQWGENENLQPLSDAAVESYIADIGSLHHVFDDIIQGGGSEFAFVGGQGYRKNLIAQIIRNMQAVSTDLFFDNYEEAVREVRKRAMISLVMRASQGQRRATRPTGYPRSCGADPGPRVSEAADPYWITWPDKGNSHYWFELSAAGNASAHEALRSLIFNHQRSACLRSLMHCDYMISAQQFYVMAEIMGATDFNQAVRDGDIQLEIRWNSYQNIVADTATSAGDNQSLQQVELNSEDDFIIGDHVMFYNHDAFDDMNRVHKNVEGQFSNWRLENAIVTDFDNNSGEFRFQGHGYFSPKVRSQFVTAMVGKMNDLVDAANSAIRSGNTHHLSLSYTDGSQFEVVREEVSGSWKIRYHRGLDVEQNQTVDTMELRRFTPADYPHPFIQPGKTRIKVRRPIESRREEL